jgi:uncharacterized protein YdeI (YjbR/CyaY-like superfamily)
MFACGKNVDMRAAKSKTMKLLFFPSSSDFRRWLNTGHRAVEELWLGFYKKSTGKPSITYSEAVDEALCYGWIDGVRKSIDSGAYMVRFTPRRGKSQWSAVNIKRAEKLVAAGRMRPPGLKAFEGAKDQPRTYSYEQRHKASFDKAMERQFRANRKAWDFFLGQAPWYRRVSTFWIMSAKQEETRKRRFSTLVSDCEHGLLVKPLRRVSGSKRKGKTQ